MSWRERLAEWMDDVREVADSNARNVRRAALVTGAGAVLTAVAFSPLWRKRRAYEAAGLARDAAVIRAQVLSVYADGALQCTTLPPLRRVLTSSFASASAVRDDETVDVRLAGVDCSSAAAQRWLRARARDGLPLVKARCLAHEEGGALGRGAVLAAVGRRRGALWPLQTDLAAEMIRKGLARVDEAAVWRAVADGRVGAGRDGEEEAATRELVGRALAGTAATDGAALLAAAEAAASVPGAAPLAERMAELRGEQARFDEAASRTWGGAALRALGWAGRGASAAGKRAWRAVRR